jgi:hypothetical protein
MHRNPYRYNFFIGKIIALNQQIAKIFFTLIFLSAAASVDFSAKIGTIGIATTLRFL